MDARAGLRDGVAPPGEIGPRQKPPRAERRRRRKELTQTSAQLRVIDPTDRKETREVKVGHGRGAIAVGHGAIWIAHGYGRTLTRLDHDSLEVTGVVPLGKPPAAIAIADDAVWVLGANGWLWRVDPSGQDAAGVARLGPRGRALATASGFLWALQGGGEVSKIDPASGDVVLESSVGRKARHLVAFKDTIWASSGGGRKLVRVDPSTGSAVAEAKPPGRAVALALDERKLWAAWRPERFGRRRGVCCFDASSGAISDAFDLPEQPRAIAPASDALWVACGKQSSPKSSVMRVDKLSGATETIDTAYCPAVHLIWDGDRLLETLTRGLNSFAGGDGVFWAEGSDLGGGFGDGGGGGGDGGGGGGN